MINPKITKYDVSLYDKEAFGFNSCFLYLFVCIG